MKQDWVFTIKEVCEILKLSRPSVRALIQRGELRVVRAGKRILIPSTALAKFCGISEDELDFLRRREEEE